MALAWPAVRIKRRSFHLQNVSRSGGAATNGVEQVVDSASGRWMASFDLIIAGDAQFLAWEAFLAAMRGRSNTVLLPYRQHRRASWPIDAYGRALSPSFTRRPRLDGTDYESPDVPTSSDVIAVLSGSVAIRATVAAINTTQGEPVQAGQYFSVGSRLYRVQQINGTAGTIQTVTFWPPARVAMANGADVELLSPACEMRFATDDEGRIYDDGTGKAEASCDFVEALF